MIIGIVCILILAVCGLLGLLVWAAKTKHVAWSWPDFGWGALIGLGTDFLDTLGIGSFVTTTAIFQATHYLKDERKLPGTLNTAHAIPTAFEALFFVTATKVEPLTLISLVLAAIVGAVLGSEVIVKLNQQLIQKIMGTALIATAILMILRLTGQIAILGADNSAWGLHGWALLIGIIGNFILGVLMAAGVGLYAPSMVMVYLLGLRPIAAFPIMMLSCALLMPSSAWNFIRKDRVDFRGLFGIVVGGIIGVVIAAKLVTALPMTTLSWLIVIVSFVTAYSLWQAALRQRPLP